MSQGIQLNISDSSLTTTPEPGTVVGLLGLGLGFVAVKRKKQA